MGEDTRKESYIKPIRILTIAIMLTTILSTVAHASTTGTFAADSTKTITASATDTQGLADSSEQYYLTVNKDSGVSTVTSSQWVNKGSSVNVTATAKSGYKITGGTGSTGAMNVAKTINVTSELDGYTLTWSASLSQYGSYLGTGNVTGSSNNKGSKRIVYTNTNGQTAYANPYNSGSITIKSGTIVTLQMVSGSNNSNVRWIVGGAYIDQQYSDSYTLISSRYTPTTSGTLSVNRDNDRYNNNYSLDIYEWGVRLS